MTTDGYGAPAVLGAVPVGNATLFQYGLTTVPATIDAGRRVSISITVSNTSAAPIDLKELEIHMPSGSFPTDLSDGFADVHPHPSAGWSLRKGTTPGTFYARPLTPSDQPIGANSRVFTVSNILVNDNPGGPVDITLTETTEPGGRRAKVHKFLTKAPMGFFLEDVTATPLQADYDGSSEVSWHATPGSVISIDFDGSTITSQKGGAGKPLPAKGSYRFDHFKAPTTVAVIAHNRTGVGPQQLTQSVNIQVSAARITRLDASVSQAGGTPVAALDWDIKSATAATLSSNRSDAATVIDPHGGHLDLPLALETDFTVSAHNPFITTPVTKTVTATPQATDWVRIDAASALQVITYMAPVAQGVLAASPSKFHLTRAGVDWTDVGTPPEPAPSMLGPNAPAGEYLLYITGLIPVGAAYVSSYMTIVLGPPVPSGQRAGKNVTRLFSTADMKSWTKLPDAPWAETINVKPAMAVNDRGHVFIIGGMDTQTEVWTSTDGMQTWTKLASGVCGPPRSYAGLAWFGGKLWLFGGQTAQGKNLADIWSSPDGKTWTQQTAPAGWEGLPSPAPAIFGGKLCLFMSSNAASSKAQDIALWRMDAHEVWTQDPPIPNAQSLPQGGAMGVPVAAYDGALFAYFSNSETIDGFWMRNT